MGHYLEVLAVGSRVSIRAELSVDQTGLDSDVCVLTSVRGWKLHLDRSILKVPGDGLHFTFCHFQVSQIQDEHVWLAPTSHAFVLGHFNPDFGHLALELCCGLGGISSGAQHAGVTVLGGMDVSSLAVEVYNMNHVHPAFVGDISDHASLAKLFSQAGFRSVGLLMGFPCPPFSCMGDMKGFVDTRAHTFLHGLDAAYLLRSSWLLLECTPLVESFAGFTKALDSFCAVMNFRWTSQILQLDSAWPVKRTRWWCLITSPAVSDVLQVASLPFSPHLQSIESILPEWPCWTPSEEAALRWDDAEVHFHSRFAQLSDLCLNCAGKSPTLLHSLGHLDRPCSCGCRLAAFSEHRLASNGISTVMVHCSTCDGYRHLHASEAGFFNTLSPAFKYPPGRLALPLVGQVAAPLQAHWMITHLLKALQIVGGVDDSQQVVPLRCHVNLQTHLMQMAYHLLPTAATAIPRCVTFRFPGGCKIVFEVAAGLCIESFLQEQRALGGWDSGFEVRLFEHPVPPHAILRSACYDVLDPTLLGLACSYKLVLHGRAWTGSFASGITVRALLDFLGFPSQPPLALLVNHASVDLDFRLTSSFVGVLSDDVFIGAGVAPILGLSDWQIDSEMLRLQRIAGSVPNMRIFSALELSSLLTWTTQQATAALAQLILPEDDEVFGIFCFEGHWAAFSFDRVAAVARYYDGLPGLPYVASFLIDTIARIWQLPGWTVQRQSLLFQDGGSHCGIIALINFGEFLGLWNEFTEDAALEWFHTLMRPSFIGAGGVEYTRAHALLVEELPKHGVSAADAPSRAAAALKKMGIQPILKAFQAKHPWQALKSLGNTKDRPFQWVQHSELERHVARRAADKTAPMQKVRKLTEKRGQSVTLVPAQIRVPDGTFQDANGELLKAITMDEISNTARGVVVATQEEAYRFLRDAKSISVDCLAILTLAALDIAPDVMIDCTDLTWPAILADTQEPLLVRGTCIQLGDLRAEPCTGPTKSISIETDLIRLFIYRDQWPLDWKRLTDGPLRMLIQHFPCLQFCGKSCADGCSKFHPAVEEVGIKLVVLDAFAWKWNDATGRAAQAAKAASFSLMVRIPRSGTQMLMACSGVDGLYTELRDDVNKTTHSAYSVVWLADDYEGAKHKLRSTDFALHLVRFHNKYGLRCHKKDTKALHTLLFPDRKFIDCGTALRFEMGPWPWGTTKDAIAECLESLQWKAKPLKPVTGGRSGRFWLIGSADEPANLAVPYANQFLTITKVKDTPVSKPVPNVVASLKTLQKLATPAAATSSADPWASYDPWKSTTAKPSTPVVAPSSSKLDEMETRLAAKLAEQLQEQVKTVNDEMEDTSQVQQLQASVTELTAQQKTFTQWCSEAATKITAINQTMVAQDARMSGIEQQVQSNTQKTEQLGSQLTSWQSSFKADFETAMNKQTASLEALLEKRQKHWLPRQPLVSVRWVSHWFFVLLSCLFLRVGEATNPGPPMDFALGVANPSGLSHKEFSFLELPVGIWNVAETQASETTFRRFARALRSHQGTHRNLSVHHGEFAPLRVGSTFAGAWTGVAQISDFPSRPLHIPWRGAEYRSGRCLISAFNIGTNCLLGASVYAPPKGPTYSNARQLTGELLATITEELVIGRSGFRFVAGDFNCAPTEQEAFFQWKALGWIEVQELARLRFGTIPQPTCKGATQPDQLWISPELQAWFLGVEVCDSRFADHATVSARLCCPDWNVWQYHWHQPSLLPWDALSLPLDFGSQTSFDWNAVDLTSSFRAWSSLAEDELIRSAKNHVFVPASCKGRGQTLETQCKPFIPKLVSSGRQGDVLPRSSLLGRQVHLWFKQLRRLQAFHRRAASSSASLALAADLVYTWKAIVSASGFRPSFQAWWPLRHIRLHGSPEEFPVFPPGPDMARQLFLDFEANFRAFERWNLRQRTKVIRARYFHHNKLLYQQLRPCKASAVTHFVHTTSADVVSVHGLDLRLRDAMPAVSSSSWTLEGIPVQVASSDGVTVSLDPDTDLVPVAGQLFRQSKLLNFCRFCLLCGGCWSFEYLHSSTLTVPMWLMACCCYELPDEFLESGSIKSFGVRLWLCFCNWMTTNGTFTKWPHTGMLPLWMSPFMSGGSQVTAKLMPLRIELLSSQILPFCQTMNVFVNIMISKLRWFVNSLPFC